MMNVAGVGAAAAAMASDSGGIELYEMDSRIAAAGHGGASSSSSSKMMPSGLAGLMGGNRISDGREMATNICRQYIRSSSRYLLLDHLQDIGKTRRPWPATKSKVMDEAETAPLIGVPSGDALSVS